MLAVLPAQTPPSLGPVDPMLEFDRTGQALLATPIGHAGGVVQVPGGALRSAAAR